MKKLVSIIFAISAILMLICNSLAATETSDVKILINDVKVALVNEGKVIEPLQEGNIVYVPLTAFLDVLNISYSQDNNTFLITLSSESTTPLPTSTPSPTPTPKTPYESLSSSDKTFLDIFLMHITEFYDPSSVSFVEIHNGKSKYQFGYDEKKKDESSSSGYFVKVSAANKLGGKVFNWYYVDKYSFVGHRSIDTRALEGGSFDIVTLNKALKYKLDEMGY